MAVESLKKWDEKALADAFADLFCSSDGSPSAFSGLWLNGRLVAMGAAAPILLRRITGADCSATALTEFHRAILRDYVIPEAAAAAQTSSPKESHR